MVTRVLLPAVAAGPEGASCGGRGEKRRGMMFLRTRGDGAVLLAFCLVTPVAPHLMSTEALSSTTRYATLQPATASAPLTALAQKGTPPAFFEPPAGDPDATGATAPEETLLRIHAPSPRNSSLWAPPRTAATRGRAVSILL